MTWIKHALGQERSMTTIAVISPWFYANPGIYDRVAAQASQVSLMALKSIIRAAAAAALMYYHCGLISMFSHSHSHFRMAAAIAAAE